MTLQSKNKASVFLRITSIPNMHGCFQHGLKVGICCSVQFSSILEALEPFLTSCPEGFDDWRALLRLPLHQTCLSLSSPSSPIHFFFFVWPLRLFPLVPWPLVGIHSTRYKINPAPLPLWRLGTRGEIGSRWNRKCEVETKKPLFERLTDVWTLHINKQNSLGYAIKRKIIYVFISVFFYSASPAKSSWAF